MPFVAIDHTIEFAIDAIIKASNHQQLDQNVDYLKALFNISTGHTHDGVTTDDGPPVAAVADGAVTLSSTAPTSYSAALSYVVNQNPLKEGLGSCEAEVTITTTTSYQKLYEVRVKKAGTYRVRFQTKSSVGTSGNYTKIHKNGSEFGTEWDGGTAYVLRSEDITFAAGDLVAVYGKSSIAGRTCYVKEFRLWAAERPIGFDTDFVFNS